MNFRSDAPGVRQRCNYNEGAYRSTPDRRSLPLPRGEGRGEGKGSVESATAQSFYLAIERAVSFPLSATEWGRGPGRGGPLQVHASNAQQKAVEATHE